MANKRQLKKMVNNACKDLVYAIFISDCAAGHADDTRMLQLLTELDTMHTHALAAATFSFDKTPRDFDNRHAYNVAKSKYFRKAYTEYHKEFTDSMQKIVDQINAILPKE